MKKPLGQLMAAMGVVVLLVGARPPVAATAQAPSGDWNTVPTRMNARMGDGCFDTLHPDYWWSEGTVYNWRTAAVVDTFWSRASNSVACGPGGWAFSAWEDDQAPHYRAKIGTPYETIDHAVDAWAYDGSLRVFAVEGGKLWVSGDAGKTWIERGQQFKNTISHVAVAAADSQVVYLLTTSEINASRAAYSVYASSDAGVSWELRQESVIDTGSEMVKLHRVYLETPPAITAPTSMVMLKTETGFSRQVIQGSQLSNDGGRTWATSASVQSDYGSYFVFTHEGVIRVTMTTALPRYSLDISLDGGATWQALPTPSEDRTVPMPNNRKDVHVSINPWVPANVLVEDGNGAWYSSDGGRSWQQTDSDTVGGEFAGHPAVYGLTPSVSVLRIDPDGTTAIKEMPMAGRSSTLPTADVNAPAGRYFSETRHNLSPLFVTYWSDHGGLAQFGYPKTEPLLEYNPADGNTYIVQYFERNRFEYHPEHAGSQYEVLLGLLGTQMTADRANTAPFQPFNGHIGPDQVFFPETKHTLGKPFRSYWEQHGGLALYGYPISEPFQELNPDDGKHYTVQYFERARFEHHPEYAGTTHEVLLGLLGNALLRQKGW